MINPDFLDTSKLLGVKPREKEFHHENITIFRGKNHLFLETCGERRCCPGHLQTEGVSTNTYYQWKRKYGGMGISEARRLRLLEAENSRLRSLVSDLTLDKHILQETIEKKFSGARMRPVCQGKKICR